MFFLAQNHLRSYGKSSVRMWRSRGRQDQNQPGEVKAPRSQPRPGWNWDTVCAQADLWACPHLSAAQLWNGDDRGIVSPSSLTSAKLPNPLTEVAAQQEHRVVVFWVGFFFFLKTLKRWAIERVTNIVHCLFRNAWWNPSQQGKRACEGDEKRCWRQVQRESSGTRVVKASISLTLACEEGKEKFLKKGKERKKK